MKKLFLVLGLMAWVPTLHAADSCQSDADCAASRFGRYCDVDFEVCSDCCAYVEQVVCPSACTWAESECRNDAAIQCGPVGPDPERTHYH